MIDKKMKRYLEDVEVLEKTIIKINETVFCKSKFLTFAKLFPQAPVGNFYVNSSGFTCLISMCSARILAFCCFGRGTTAGGSGGVFGQLWLPSSAHHRTHLPTLKILCWC